MKRSLTKEQTQHLIDLGLDKTRIYYGNDCPNRKFIRASIRYYMFDILDSLPQEIVHNGVVYTLSINANADKTDIGYLNNDYLILFAENELIDAAYKLVIWCIENGYIKTNN